MFINNPRLRLIIGIIGISLTAACNVFPVWPPNFFEEPPTDPGEFGFREYRVDVPDGADGQPAGITMFVPEQAEEPVPALLWVLGSNVQAYYHQSLHEILASWGYAVIIPDGRPLTFTDFNYHRRNVDLAKQAFDLAVDGELGIEIDPERIAVGGYSIGGTMATFLAAEEPRAAAIVMWAPTRAPFWTGVEPDPLFAAVTQPSYFLLGEFDNIEPPDGFPREMQTKMEDSESTEYIIPEGLHLYFQQVTAADSITDPLSSITRFEQQGIAIERTLSYLNEQLAAE
ncbi:MAG: dienelactone hydrolase family protein [Phycisphaerae bacterium]